MDPQQAAKNLVDTLAVVLGSDAVYKANVAGAIVDQLLGTDPHAVVRNVKGMPAELVELITDGLVDAIKAEVIKRLTAPA